MIAADLRSLRNVVRTAEGRRALLSQLVVLACVVSASLAFAGSLLLAPQLVEAVKADTSGRVLRLCYSITLVLPLLLVLGVGVSQFTRDLYRAPPLPLLLTAPVSSFAVVGSAYLRGLFGWLVFGVAFGLPPVLGLAERAGVPLAPAWLHPLAFASLAAPIVAFQVLLKVALVAWLSSPRLRGWLTAVHVTVCLLLALLLVFGLLSGREIGAALAERLVAGFDLPWVLEAPAALMAAGAGFSADAPLLWSNLLWAGLALPLLAAAAWPYRRSYDRFLVTVDPVRRAARGTWPETPLRSFLRKTWIGSVRVKSNLALYAFLAVVMVVLVDIDRGAPDTEQQFPAVLRDAFALLRSWQGLVLLVACVAFLGMVGTEQGQIALLATAPFARRHLLNSNLLAVASPFVACLLVAVVAAPAVAGVGPAVLGLFVLAASPILLFLLGVICMAGTWPSMLRVHDTVPLANSLRSALPVLVIGGCGAVAMFAVLEARYGLSACYHGHGALSDLDGATAAWLLLAIAWAVGLLVFAAGYRVGLANLRRLLGPQPD